MTATVTDTVSIPKSPAVVFPLSPPLKPAAVSRLKTWQQVWLVMIQRVGVA